MTNDVLLYQQNILPLHIYGSKFIKPKDMQNKRYCYFNGLDACSTIGQLYLRLL